MNTWNRSIARLFKDDRKLPLNRRRSSLSVEQLEGRNLMSVSPIAYKVGGYYDSVDVNGIFYFSTTAGELWKTDGTPGGTALVKDLDPLSSTGEGPNEMTNVNGTLFFLYNDPANGRMAVWKSDGTDAGTIVLKDLDGGPPWFYWYHRSAGNLAAVNGFLYFSDMDSTGNHDSLWKSDGTRDGTVLVKDGFDTPIGSVGIHEMTNVNGTLFFAYSDAYKTDGLWKSDGTSAGTVQVRPDLAGVDGLVNVNGKLVFTSEDRVPATDNGISLGWKKAIGQDLWITDGTDNGTVFLKHSSSIGFGPPINVNGSIYIFELNYELLLWKSDGTVAGTHLVRSFSDLNTIDNSLADVNGTLYFISRGPSQYALWKSDGTEAGTVLIEELGTEDFYYGSQLTNVNGTLYFSDIYETAQGTVSLLWRSDGTEVGTTIVPETNLNPSFSLLWQLTSVNGNLFFVDLANSGTTNTQGLIVGKVDTGDGSPSSPVDLSSLDAKTISDPPPDPGLVLPPFYPPYKAVPDSFSALLIPPPQDPEPSQPKSEVGKMDVSNIQVSLAVTNSAGPVANQSNGSQSIDSIQAPAQSSSLLTNSSGLTNASSNSVDLVQVRAQKSNGIAADDEISTADLDSLFALAAIDPEIALQRD